MQDKGQFAEGGVVTVLNDEQHKQKMELEEKLIQKGMTAREAHEAAIKEMSKGKAKLKTITPKEAKR